MEPFNTITQLHNYTSTQVHKYTSNSDFLFDAFFRDFIWTSRIPLF